MPRTRKFPGGEPTSKESGFILVAVLWIIAALATLASIYSLYASNVASTSHVADDRLQAEASIRAGVELAVFQIFSAPDSAQPTHGNFASTVGKTKITVEYRSEAGRIDLNAAPKETLAGIFRAVGVEESAASRYADRIIGWRERALPSDESEAVAYKTAALAYAPRQAPFNNTLELYLVLGLPPAVVERVLPFFTVFSGKPQIDVMSASPETLAALPSMTPERLKKVLQARAINPNDGAGLLDLLGPARAGATTEGSKAFRAIIHVYLAHGRVIRSEVVFVLSDSGDDPYDIVYWRDDFDAPF